MVTDGLALRMKMSEAGQNDPGTCWLCERPLGVRVQWHHTVPKGKGGRLTVPLHPICHRAIHAYATNAELARMAGLRAPLHEVANMAAFLRWIATKPPDFHAPVRPAKR